MVLDITLLNTHHYKVGLRQKHQVSPLPITGGRIIGFISFLGGARFIVWGLRSLFFKGMLMWPEVFLEIPCASALQSCAWTSLKKALCRTRGKACKVYSLVANSYFGDIVFLVQLISFSLRTCLSNSFYAFSRGQNTFISHCLIYLLLLTTQARSLFLRGRGWLSSYLLSHLSQIFRS